MRIAVTRQGVRIEAPAKVNLYLEVLGKRSDGYHEIETVLCPISLFDSIAFTALETPEIELVMRTPPAEAGDAAWAIPHDASNLVVRGVQAVRQQLGVRQGCRIELQKTIPAAAGLGGGSSDTAAAVVASLIAWDRWDRELATHICAQLGSDIPFFLGKPTGIGLTLATGRGEQCRLLTARPELDLMLTHPPVGCSTQAVYAKYRAPEQVRQFGDFVSACETGQVQKIGAELFNALQFPASSVTDWIERQLQLFADGGAAYALMTGSGSSCFALLEELRTAPRIRELAAALGLKRVYSAKAWYGDSIEQQLLTQVG